MAENFGPGVTRNLTALMRQFQTVVYQKGKPPLDSEFNLLQQVQNEAMAQLVRSQTHSGFFMDPTRPLDDFLTDPNNANQFRFGSQKRDEDVPEERSPIIWANVNGWIIPVVGTHNPETNGTENIITLNPPPVTNSRIDFVFLEVWRVLVAPGPSTSNKPSSTKIWSYGNVEFGQANQTDDLIDPAIGFETTERVQLQYRIRVVGQGTGAGVSPDLATFPDGLEDPNVRAQGPLANPSGQAYAVFTNMRKELGDASLWRAGNGDPTNALKTVDGYVYALPICALFRRNSSPYVAVNQAGSPNQNGAFNRTPSSALLTNPRDGAKLLQEVRLVSDLPGEQFSVLTEVEVETLVGTGFDDSGHNFNQVFMVIDDEVIAIDSIDTTIVPNRIRIPAGGRGRWGTDPSFHAGRDLADTENTGSLVKFFNTRPDGLYADQIAQEDILDMRRAVNLGDWDYDRLLLHNVSALMRNRLRSTWKVTGVPGGNTEGVSVREVDYLFQDGQIAVPNGTEALDGPDGIRYVWSDAAALQTDTTMLLDNEGTMNSGFIQTFDDQVSWDVGADFKPSGFVNNLNNAEPGFQNGSTIFVYIGGDSGNAGARKTFRDGSTRSVRFVAPKEHFAGGSGTGLQTPVTLQWFSSDQANSGVQDAGAGLQALVPAGPGEVVAEHPGPMYPLSFLNFEKPFLVCGGLLNTASEVTGIIAATQLFDNSTNPAIPLGEGEIAFPGVDFDVDGDWYSLDSNGQIENNSAALNFPVLRGQRTLWDLLTAGGTDLTGSSSEAYCLLFGDIEAKENNGAFQILGAGTVGYTAKSASAANRIRVRFLSQGVTQFDQTSGQTLTAQVRSQWTNSEDGAGQTNGPSALTITLTDIECVAGGASNPWSQSNINPGAALGKTLQQPFDYKCLVNTTLMYHPGRGGMLRVPDMLSRVAIQSAPASVLRQSPATLDTTFASATGAPSNPSEVTFDTAHVQTWNRLPSLGLKAPYAPNYGGNVVLFSEVDREHEAFFDGGSKTLLFRPYQDLAMTLKAITLMPTNPQATLFGIPDGVNALAGQQYPSPSLILNGWDGAKDDAQIWTSGRKMGFALPAEFMPRFGRQDIPYFQDKGPNFGQQRFLEGINHLFTDKTDLTNPVFNIIGGQDNQSGGILATRFLAQTGSTSGFLFGQYGTITGPTTPAYQARLTTEIGTGTANASEITSRLNAVASSDFGVGLRGIQLPPYQGVARLYGVYERQDFVNKGGVTYDSDRVTPLPNRAINLLRRDAKKQTLFILQNGAKDLTGQDGDHTYLIPENALDITRVPGFQDGDTFTDFEYVVEYTCFGFANGFIDKNNFVFARRHNGQGALLTDGSNPELENVRMTLPHAAPDSSRVYVDYTRTVYQGDPYMTRAGATITTSDYEARLGEVAQSNAFELATAIQQFDADGEQIPQTPNVRGLEVLAALDFYTTLGTGNMGGRVYPGTVTDVGYTEDNPFTAERIPPASNTPANRILTRAFTEGQKKNTSRAFVDLRVIDQPSVFFPTAGASQVEVRKLDGTLVTFTANNGATADVDKFDASSPDEVVVAKELADKINARTELADTLLAIKDKDSQILRLWARPVGAEGLGIRVRINDTSVFVLDTPKTGEQGLDAVITSTFLCGGEDIAFNAGNGTSKINLTGMTDRFPLGILVNDHDFMGENPLKDNASAFQTFLGGIRPVQNLLPLTQGGGEEYTQFAGAPGELIALSDGAILQFGAFTDSNPGGSRKFRLYRGGGAPFVLGGRNPGGPVDWISGNLEEALQPVLKGGLLACKALLVRNYPEAAFASESTRSQGDEIQMVILTQAILGDGATRQHGVDLDGVLSPTGFGEGLAAADRYRLNGHPMIKGRGRAIPDPETLTLAPFPGRDSE